MADFLGFWIFSWPACSLKIAQLSKGSYSSALMLRLCACLLFVAVAATRFEVESHKVFFRAFFPHSIVLKTTVKISDRTFVNMNIRLPIVRSLRNSHNVFFYPRYFDSSPFDATTANYVGFAHPKC